MSARQRIASLAAITALVAVCWIQGTSSTSAQENVGKTKTTSTKSGKAVQKKASKKSASKKSASKKAAPKKVLQKKSAKKAAPYKKRAKKAAPNLKVAKTKTPPKKGITKLAANKSQANDPALLNTPSKEKLERLIFTATLEGLYTDGVQADVVDMVLKPNKRLPHFSQHFVYGCPICMPAFDAFRVYQKRVPLTPMKKKVATSGFGTGLSKELRGRLLSDDYQTRLGGIAELTKTWMDRRFRSMRLTPEEKIGWTRLLAEGRKTGLSGLLMEITGTKRKVDEDVDAILAKAQADGRMAACPFCDGAACSIEPQIPSIFFPIK